jgi:hypothetical protein
VRTKTGFSYNHKPANIEMGFRKQNDGPNNDQMGGKHTKSSSPLVADQTIHVVDLHQYKI